MAGLNAARRAQGLEPVAFPRTGSYIGTLIDDLVTKARCRAVPLQSSLGFQGCYCTALPVFRAVCNPALSMLLFMSSAYRQLYVLMRHMHVCICKAGVMTVHD